MECSLSRYGPTPGIPGVPYFPNMVQEFFDLIPPTPRPHLFFLHFKVQKFNSINEMLHLYHVAFLLTKRRIQIYTTICRGEKSLKHNYVSAFDPPPFSFFPSSSLYFFSADKHVSLILLAFKTMNRKCFFCTGHIAGF